MTRTENLVIIGTLAVIFVSAFFNFRISQVKARDIQRKSDLKHVRAALDNYIKDHEVYPESLTAGFVRDYIHPLPRDPQESEGRKYLYRSNTKQFQIYASLEQKKEIEYNGDIERQGFLCGDFVCNFGIASANDVSLLEELK